MTCQRSSTNFLTDRTQQVVVDGKISFASNVLSGVFQGSVLGPLLFTFYIHDVVDSLSTYTTCKLFSDDLTIYYVLIIINDSNSILSAFDTIKQWASIWQLQIHESNWLFIGQTASSFINANFASDNKAMSSVSGIKDLGVFITAILVLANQMTTELEELIRELT